MDIELINRLNKFTNFEYKFELKSACLDSKADFCVVEILYKDGVLLDKAKVHEIEDFMLGLLPKKYKYEFKFIKKFINEELLKEQTESYLKHNHPSIAFQIIEVKRQDDTFKVDLKIDELSYEYAEKKCIKDEIQSYFHKNFTDFAFLIEISKDKILNLEPKSSNKFYEENNFDQEKRIIEVSDVIEFVGEKIEKSARYIKDLKLPQENVILCGKVKGIKSLTVKPKVAQNQKTENAENKKQKKPAERVYFKWVLQDFTSDIICSFLSNKENRSKLETLSNETEIIVFGNLVEDNFNNGLTLNVKAISLCKLPENFVEVISYHKERPEYEYVFPEKIITYSQKNLLDLGEEQTPEFLLGKTFVCYDLETTGISYNSGDKMIELGAVKIVDGKIIENFETLVCPDGRHISEGASATNGFTDIDVVDAPKDYQVLQDFYKFTRGATLIGYNNNGFDDIFLVGQGKNARWNFDNPTMDVYKIAREQIRGLKNYKLETVAKSLGVVNKNAHRAWYDAMATAEIFIKLAKNLKI